MTNTEKAARIVLKLVNEALRQGLTVGHSFHTPGASGAHCYFIIVDTDEQLEEINKLREVYKTYSKVINNQKTKNMYGYKLVFHDKREYSPSYSNHIQKEYNISEYIKELKKCKRIQDEMDMSRKQYR